ncbi:beta-N-acetylhexosaminidase [Trebonia kvetii]|uniref:Beta-N-acetylhexosaminidase n=1 Tax=Trebonia kvetii TaxID=2480626 RepID=A0A6P2BUS0_9ACTN|nr:glycoside hydrolase family 3 N-terminal domain-containing protein [Trebonia kvetii]TVZ02638.1 beta-N-acetylhexosaminidase [Trebonia kvetii]
MRIQRKLLVAGALALGLALPTVASAHALTTRADGREAVGTAVPASLSAQQLAGQRVIYSYSGLNPPASLITLIKHGEAAGVIFFGQNISSKTQIAAVIKRLEQANASPLNPVRAPLLLMTDQEGGEVRRLPGQPNLSEKQIGAQPLPQAKALATAAGQGAAANLRGVGMNVNLAPVLDVYRKAGDFDDQFGRSYSMKPAVVSALGANMIKAQQAGGVAAAAKHFPGLGAATAAQNTDAGPVTLHLTLSAIRGTDEAPFKTAISAGVRLVMLSWAVYPAIQALPAGLSPKVVQGELRNRLKFTGVTITDALEAGALKKYGSTANRTLLAARAGMDLILASTQGVTQGQQARAELATAYSKGILGHQGFLASVNRVIALRKSLK